MEKRFYRAAILASFLIFFVMCVPAPPRPLNPAVAATTTRGRTRGRTRSRGRKSFGQGAKDRGPSSVCRDVLVRNTISRRWGAKAEKRSGNR
jgi:hypothetical protein